MEGLKINFSPSTLVDALKFMGIGLVCIFLVVGVIAFGVWVLNKVTKKKKTEEPEEEE